MHPFFCHLSNKTTNKKNLSDILSSSRLKKLQRPSRVNFGPFISWLFYLAVDALMLQSFVIRSKTYLHRANLGKQRAQELDGQHSDDDAQSPIDIVLSEKEE